MVVVWAPGPARAQTTVQDRINSALGTWMAVNGVSNAGMAVMRDNRLVGSYGYNQMSAETPAHVASLSKAITAVCFLSLIDDRRLAGFRTALYSLPPSFLDATGPWSPGVANITVEQLLRHRSRIYIDTSQGSGLVGVPNADSSDVILIRRALAEHLLTMPVSEIYNNINYAILGYIIQTITQESYESYCRRTALAPRGAPNARIGPGTRALGAFGGWEISAVEYAMFARAYDPRSGLLSQAGHDFIIALANSSSPTASLGMFVVRTATGRNLFHHGSWSSTVTTPQQFSSFFAMWDNGISVTVTYDRNLTDSARLDLDNTLRRAAYSSG
ncbi:serine hydrolase domain-containing protein [Sphaerisporangium corydalis]|uniref:Serine hydrolase domain-containing protein n=1 Tax=Sphaerisporangium corydalis TaxID=1441875 RepID=A0ABV9EDK2_9ACTN|nr:serine hydrolase domain-containing protein [Sphaerisporangium corydalis]